jgi:prepilin-type N-terminal cleavage/methylation domain-containing protein
LRVVWKRAFTLIELLVVVAIIGLLVSIAVPSLGRARASGKRAACASNLRQIGIAMRSYLGAANDRLPYASYMPSVSPAPLDGPDPIYIADVLANDTGHQENVFRCPNDISSYSDDPNKERLPPNVNKTYFETERSSYEYRDRLAGQTLEEYVARIRDRTGQVIAPSSVWIFRDFNNFHAPAGALGSRRYVYIDGHVTDFEN